MEQNKLRVAIISDLHCHPERDTASENNTLLYSDKLRSPTNEHPVENLLKIIKKEGLKVDLVLSPGDFTHQSDKQGFLSGWSYVTELARALKSPDVVATLGNHDIDSRHTYSNYSFDIPKKIMQDFPIEKKYLGNFWDSGFTFIELDTVQILVINSTHFHTHYETKGAAPIDNPSVKGKVDTSQLEQIEDYLKNNNTHKIKIALFHHHPVIHSRSDLGEYDFIENGQLLMDVLGRFKFDLVIHGHKHDPWLRYVNTECGFNIPVLSSGSFSATNQILWISKFNYFHIVELTKASDGISSGQVETLTFKNKVGWSKDKDDGFLPYTGFGYKDSLEPLLDKVKQMLTQKSMLKWDDVSNAIPELKQLTPDKMEALEALFEENQILLNGKIGLKPKHVYYERI